MDTLLYSKEWHACSIVYLLDVILLGIWIPRDQITTYQDTVHECHISFIWHTVHSLNYINFAYLGGEISALTTHLNLSHVFSL